MHEDRKESAPTDQAIEDIIRCATILTEASEIPFYLYNNDEMRFLHISSAFSDLTNISYEDFKSGRVINIGSIVHEKDLELMIGIGQKSEEFLSDNRLSGEALTQMVFSTNFRIRTDSGYMFVDHHSYPVYLDQQSYPLISANFLRPSHKRGIDRLTFYAVGNDIRLFYSQKQKKFVPEHKMHLKEVELSILRLSADGLIEKQICDKLGVKPSMVNYHKREIFNKLNVTSIQEAVYVALLSELI